MIETAHGPDDLSPDGLPTDPDALRAFIREVIAERDAAIARCLRLEHLLSVARNARYGRSSEKLNDDQLQFVLEDVEQAVAAIEASEDRSNPEKSASAPPPGGPIAGLFPSTCRASSRRSRRSIRTAPAAARRCMRSAPMRSSASTSFPPNIG